MNSMLEQFLEPFLVEARDFLQSIGEKLMALEDDPANADIINELFRYVHTLKGNSGIFEFPEMTRVLHAGEDLMDAVRQGKVGYSRALADQLLEAMDYVSVLFDELEQTHDISGAHAETSARLTQALRELIAAPAAPASTPATASPVPTAVAAEAAPAATASVVDSLPASTLPDMPEPVRRAAFEAACQGATLTLVRYRPDPESLFKGEDPFRMARETPDLLWGAVQARESWPDMADLDYYRCALDLHILSSAPRASLGNHFRRQAEQMTLQTVSAFELLVPAGEPNGGPVYGDFVTEALSLLEQGDLEGLADAARTLLDLSSPSLWLSSALRWLLTLLTCLPDERQVLERLINAISTLEAPDFSDLSLTSDGETGQASIAAPVIATKPLTAEERACIAHILDVQANILALPDKVLWLNGRLSACATTLEACLAWLGADQAPLNAALSEALLAESSAPLAQWLKASRDTLLALPDPALTAPVAVAETAARQHHAVSVTQSVPAALPIIEPVAEPVLASPVEETVFVAPERPAAAAEAPAPAPAASVTPRAAATADSEPGTAAAGTRRNDEPVTSKVLKVDQVKIDHLMNLIGEMVVAKNALPYLANRAENQYGVRELSREIKEQYAVINRIAEDMQDAIMQVRMMPVSFVFQRFPRLVRDIARKLGKDVDLVLEGDSTEADKHVIESLADPLIHIVRNSMDHGLETPDVRRAAGKSPTGRLLIRASQESDRVIIEISDDGKGIDPDVIKRKAYEKGLIDEAQLERLSDQEAIQLIFAAGFSTAEAITDLSGRGVGMDVVRSAIDRVGGSIELTSEKGQGTSLRLSLPLSMAVTNVMIVESDRQIFGLPMDKVVETVRLPRGDIHTIKQQKTVVLRGRIVPLLSLNELLAIPAEPLANHEDELAALVVRVGNEQVGLLVDDFKGVVDVILKPLPGELSRLSCYAGTALLGDGSVLMVLNPKELI